MKRLCVWILLCSLLLVGCATKTDVQRVDQKVDKLATREDNRWTKQVQYDKAEPDRILSAIQGNIDSNRVRNQLGGGPTSHLPPSIPGVRPASPNDPRFQYTDMYDPATGQMYKQEMPVQAVAPIGGYPAPALSAGGYSPPGTPQQPMAPPQGGPPIASPPAAGSTTRYHDDIRRLDRVIERQEQALPDQNSSTGGGGLSGIPALRSQIQDVTGLIRDVKDLQEAFGGGQQNQLADVNQRLDQLSGQMTSLSDGQKKDSEELKRAFEAALKANAASKGYRVVYMVPPVQVLRSVQYVQHVVPGAYYRTWWHQPGGCVYYYRYPYNWHP
jgi:hypothetical protein